MQLLKLAVLRIYLPTSCVEFAMIYASKFIVADLILIFANFTSQWYIKNINKFFTQVLAETNKEKKLEHRNKQIEWSLPQ